MIEMTSLNKYYAYGGGKFHALKNINLTVQEGESVAIQGKSGAGKSTLLHILGCLDSFDSGSYKLDGTEIKSLGDGKASRLRNEKIGFVLQDFSLINHKSVLFNVTLPLYFGKVSSREMKKRAEEALSLVGIPEQIHKKVSQLSGGQRQRVAIARAIISRPSLLLADEPTGALDSETSKQIMELLKSMNRQGITMIVVTHDDAVAAYCNRRVLMQDGNLLS